MGETPKGDDDPDMIPLPIGHAVRRVNLHDADRIMRSCSHVTIPSHPAAAGYRYLDLGGDHPPFYVRRLSLADRSAAVVLRAPVELTAGDEAERGAPAVARCELTVGPRSIPWSELLTFTTMRGESAILAQRAVDAVTELNLLQPDICPVCAA